MIDTAKKIETKVATILLDDEGILRVYHKNNVEMGLAEAKLHAEACCQLCEGVPRLVILDSRNIVSLITPEARKYLANHEELLKIRKAHAIIVDSLANRLIANFYFRFNKPKGPGKVFNTEKAALTWLKNFE